MEWDGSSDNNTKGDIKQRLNDYNQEVKEEESGNQNPLERHKSAKKIKHIHTLTLGATHTHPLAVKDGH